MTINQQISYWRAILTEGIPEPSDPLSAALFDLLASGRKDRDALWLYVCDHMRTDPRRDFEDWLIACAKYPNLSQEQVCTRMRALNLRVTTSRTNRPSVVKAQHRKRYAYLAPVSTPAGVKWWHSTSSTGPLEPRTHERIKWILEAMPDNLKWWT